MRYFLFKRLIKFIAILFTTLMFVISCTPEVIKEDADDFVGTYQATMIDNVQWGAGSGIVTHNGTFHISKISANRVKVSGYITTYGEVNGKSVFFESSYDSFTDGYLTTIYQQGTLNGNVLTFSSSSSVGEMKYGNRLFPYNSFGNWTAIKQP